jgi:hypothetical protein
MYGVLYGLLPQRMALAVVPAGKTGAIQSPASGPPYKAHTADWQGDADGLP